MAKNSTSFTSPVGRMVLGSLYTPMTKDAEGQPLKIKTGPNVGQLTQKFFLALAIAKGAERHWSETSWGAMIWRIGHAAFPQAAQSPSFAWKVEDGDSAVPNKKGRKPVDNEGFKGHWILKFSSAFAPKVYRPEGSGVVQVMEVDYVKPGYFIEVLGSVLGNESVQNPGVLINQNAVCFRAFGPEINFGMDVSEAGFGQSALPAGASAVPLASSAPLPAGAAPAAPAPPANIAPPAPIVPVVPVVPNTAFLNVPAPPSGPKMTAKAAGVTYEQMIANGWTDATLLQHGYTTL